MKPDKKRKVSNIETEILKSSEVEKSDTGLTVKNVSGGKLGFSSHGRWVEVNSGGTVVIDSMSHEVSRLIGLKKLATV